MNSLVRAAMAALVFTPMFVSAQDAAPRTAQERPHTPADAFRRADTNGDGKVSLDELRTQRPNLTQQGFDRLDSDGDGFLTPTDRLKSQRGARARGTDDGAREQMLSKVMQADTDGDGRVSFEELTSSKPGFAKGDFDRLDSDSDGFISKSDAGPRQARTAADRPRPPRADSDTRGMSDAQRSGLRDRLRAGDTNGDGRVTFSEAQAAFPQMTQERFNRMDTNGDGAIGPDDRPQGGGQRRP